MSSNTKNQKTVWNPGLDNSNNEIDRQKNISKEYLNSFKSPSSSNFSSSPSSSSSLSISPRFAFIAATEQYFRLQQNNQINQLKQQQTQKQQTCSLPQLPPGILFRRPPPFFQSTSLPFPIPFIPPPNSFSETASNTNNLTTIPQPFIRPPPFLPFFPPFGGPLGNFANLAMTLAAKKQNEKSFTIVETLKEDKNNKEKIIKRRKSLINCKTRKRPFPSKLSFILNNNGNNGEITRTINDIDTQNGKFMRQEKEEIFNNSLPSTTNPIIELILKEENNKINKISNNNYLNINFNTCAICGASFRLTSELIQHARSNHRQPNRYDRLEGPSIEEARKFNKERINGNNERRK
uniref:C2H2-type domain-containing protein n=1 Tax=Meloidogyne enterolobii TaxID=390850 RepID=A0A6V7XE76_MELEN|nr:unnamed protein product [Meloidogyne enterolobii]